MIPTSTTVVQSDVFFGRIQAGLPLCISLSLFNRTALYVVLQSGSAWWCYVELRRALNNSISYSTIEQFLNSPIQLYDYMKLINSIRDLRIEAIYDQFAS